MIEIFRFITMSNKYILSNKIEIVASEILKRSGKLFEWKVWSKCELFYLAHEKCEDLFALWEKERNNKRTMIIRKVKFAIVVVKLLINQNNSFIFAEFESSLFKIVLFI